MSDLIVFDLDGVITSEEAYWDSAGLTLHELLYSPHYWNIQDRPEQERYVPASTAQEAHQWSRQVFPMDQIQALKGRAINSNWDTCYGAVCLRLIDLLALVPAPNELTPLRPWDSEWIARFRSQLASVGLQEKQRQARGFNLLESPVFQGYVGLDLINRLDIYASQVLGRAIENVFVRTSPFWSFCRSIFQEWYLGDQLYQETYGKIVGQSGKPGCIHFDSLLLPAERVGSVLERLKAQGYTLGVATGRVRQEAIIPLKEHSLLSYFDPEHISTYTEVEQAERILRDRGDQKLLSKPNRFPFLFAVEHNYQIAWERKPRAYQGRFIAIGDATSDILSAREAGGLTIAVLTGAHTPEARALLERSEPDFLIQNIEELPELLLKLDSLTTIQKTQFTELSKAERLLHRWFWRHMHLNVDSVRLVPRAVSLNSFNGFYRVGGEEYFFKTHIEEQGKLTEYYHAEQLYQAGYNIVRPLKILHEEGRQMVVYPVIHWPVMFDLMWSQERGEISVFSQDELIEAERKECHRLLELYRESARMISAEEHAQAPIHQLFWHRLAGERFNVFYRNQRMYLPGGEASEAFEDLLHYHWIINGEHQKQTLGELIERGRDVLDPRRSATAVVGHGDAHFGNVFLEKGHKYLYFDPAFAGKHDVLLDIIKPLYHNIFASWMYFPKEIVSNFHIAINIHNNIVIVEHSYQLAPIRKALLEVKEQHLLEPLLKWLRDGRELPEDWEERLRLALLCCPLLTINLLDRKRLPVSISWLGLTQAVQLGNRGIEPWREKK